MAQWRVRAERVDTGWRVGLADAATGVALLDAGGQPLLPQPRLLRRCTQGPLHFPLPPADELPMLGAALPGRELCHATEADSRLADALGELLGQQSGARGVARFGHYLLLSLLGDALWQRLAALAARQPVELGLAFDPDDRDLASLPWEAMHDGSGFVAGRHRIAITRRVLGVPQVLGPLAMPPRVLFVLGTEPGNDVIRAGAEYLGLLRSLRDRQLNLGLRTHLLSSACTRTLAAAVRQFRPDVVHFICHGIVAGGEGRLELVDSENRQRSDAVGAQRLLEALRPDAGDALPQVVVLNACASAAAVSFEAGLPLAVQLVRGGVPVVAGMSGPVADRACRLFTREFYLALLCGRPLGVAAAEGRRAALAHGGVDPEASVDWALPALLLGEVVADGGFAVQPSKELQLREQIASEWGAPEDPVFCDRFPMLQWFDQLLSDAATQRSALDRGLDLQVLAVTTNRPDQAPPLGRTWLLREYAAHAARDGHVPCLALAETLQGGGRKPATLRELLLVLMAGAATDTADAFGVAWSAVQVRRLAAMQPGQALDGDAPQELRDRYDGSDPHAPRLLAVAARLDLLDLLQRVRAQCPAPGVRPLLVLLIDDLHVFDRTVVDGLLSQVFGPAGLRAAREDIRIVFTSSGQPAEGQGATVDIITDWLGRSKWAQAVPLEPFAKGGEDLLAYRQYLLHWRDAQGKLSPLAIARPDGDPWGRWCLNLLADSVQGIPSQLKKHVPAWIGVVKAMPFETSPVFRPADDDDVLRIARAAEGGT